MNDATLEDTLRRYLSKFEEMIDPERPARARRVCERAFAFEPLDELPFVRSNGADAASIDTDWPVFPYNDTFVDPTKMLLDQLRAPFIHHQLGDYHPLNIRCNYGTVIMPSVFGVPYRLTESSLPWANHLGSRDEVRALIDRGVPDLRAELGGRCFETAQYYMEMLSPYPKLSETIVIYHPDMQGPFDIAHLIWGPDIFMGLYDCPEMVHDLLALVTETYARYMRDWKALVGEGNVSTTQWNFYMKGGIMIRDDTPVMLRTEHYEAFVKPYDQALLDEFGGCIHFCGRGDAFIASMCESRNLYGIHSSQPDLNDVELLIRSTLGNKIALLGLPEQYVPAEANTGIIVLR
jgi:hypothetical protein